MTDAPDYIDPVEGWRVWAVVDDGGRTLLRSLFYDVLWEPGVPACARCEHRQFSLRTPWRRRRTGHAAPEEHCRCGIHAAFRPGTLMPYFRLRAPGEYCRAIGRVALWGEIVECESGYRAQRAYPTQLFLPDLLRVPSRPHAPVAVESLALELVEYDVPVEILAREAERAVLPVLPAL
ncbi:MAG TPA: hypothetical protein VLN26_06475 [Gaiellaceae bacterium]|nr:hypothetical protein [Gaiellaceae bacterium]